MAGPLVELHPSNLVRTHYFLIFKSAKIFVVVSQVISDFAKISVSVPSISLGVLALFDTSWQVLSLILLCRWIRYKRTLARRMERRGSCRMCGKASGSTPTPKICFYTRRWRLKKSKDNYRGLCKNQWQKWKNNSWLIYPNFSLFLIFEQKSDFLPFFHWRILLMIYITDTSDYT